MKDLLYLNDLTIHDVKRSSDEWERPAPDFLTDPRGRIAIKVTLRVEVGRFSLIERAGASKAKDFRMRPYMPLHGCLAHKKPPHPLELVDLV